MPIHDWTRASSGGFHNFHQDWTIELYRTLNRGLLPEGYSAYTDLRISGFEPDLIAIQVPERIASGRSAVVSDPPRARQVARIDTEAGAYARKANRISIRHEFGQVVAIVEVVSPGNKDTKHALATFVTKALEFLRSGVNLVVIDLFPPSSRDPQGLHQLIWDALTDQPFEARPAGKLLTVASYDVSDGLTAYVDPLAVGDLLPDAPLFLAPGVHVNLPLEATYATCWEATPAPIRRAVEPRLP